MKQRILFCVFLIAFAAVTARATVNFTAALQNYTASPAQAYVNLLVTNCNDSSGRPQIALTSDGATVGPQPLLPSSTGVVTAVVVPNSEITCGNVIGLSRYRVEIRVRAGAYPDLARDRVIAANEFVIGPGDFTLTSAQVALWSPTAGNGIDFTLYQVTRPFRVLPFAQFPASCKALVDRLQRSDPISAGQVDYVCNGSGDGWTLVGDGGSGGGSSPILLNLLGVWASGTGYAKYDAVTYLNSSYVALTSSVGVAPGTDSTRWMLLAGWSQMPVTVNGVAVGSTSLAFAVNGAAF